MEYKRFNNEQEARNYRESKRDEGQVASLFTYGNDRYMVKAYPPPISEGLSIKESQQQSQRTLSHQADTVSRDIEDLGKIKELIASPDFGCEIEDAVFVAKKLESEHWFPTTKSVISFFDCPTDCIERIKGMVDIAIKEHDDDWTEL